jgi:hypothetical protein
MTVPPFPIGHPFDVIGRKAEEDIREGDPIEVNPATGLVRVARPWPHFTGQFDAADYEAFYVAVTSAFGIDEGISVEKAAEYITKERST